MPLLVPRFWAPAGQQIMADPSGFLADPRDRFWSASNRRVVETAAIGSAPCTMLLGEPGLGKSTAMAALRDAPRPEDVVVQSVDLGATGQEERLHKLIFEASEFRDWLAGDHILELLLDSLDEARLRIETVADLLLDGLDDVNVARLRLRIACRSGDRHHRLEQRLAQRFGLEEVEALELMTLCRRDVADLASAQGIDPERFLDAVMSRNLQPLAARPFTLRMLLVAMAGPGGLPSGAAELYRRGCRALTRENDEDRQRGQAAGHLDVTQRLAIAERIAAGIVLSGKVGVAVDELADADHATLDQLAGGREPRGPDDDEAFAVTERDVLETLSTGLFVGRGPGRFAFVHQTIAEFLAASYLSRLREQQALDLLLLREDDGTVVIPQLDEVAGWMSTLAPSTFTTLLIADPAAVLRADVARTTNEQRAALVDALLVPAAQRRVPRWDLRVHANHRYLLHPGLEAQLTNALDRANAPWPVRETAAEIAGAAKLQSLVPRLVDLALDEGEPMTVRLAATLALGRDWADPNELRRLLPLATTPDPDDDDDDLRGGALALVWPDVLDPKTLFASLSPARRRFYGGHYAIFLHSRLVSALDDAGLVVGLRWALDQPRCHHPTGELSDVVQQLLVRGWERRAVPAVFAALVAVVRTFLSGQFALLDHDERENGTAFGDRQGRRQLVEALAPDLANGTLDEANFVLGEPPLIDVGDLRWIVARLDASLGQPLERAWARLVWGLLARPGMDLNIVMEARERSLALHTITSSWFDAAPLDSPQSTSLQSSHGRLAAIQREEAEERDTAPDPLALVLATLQRIESGDIDAFVALNEHLARDPETRRAPYRWSHHADLRATPVWALLDPVDRDRVAEAAARFLDAHDPTPETWFGKNTITHGALAGYRALRLVTEQGLDVGPDSWRRWAPAVLAWPLFEDAEHGPKKELVRRCFAEAPQVAAAFFLKGLDAAARRNGVWHLSLIADARLDLVEDDLTRRMLDPAWPVELRADVLRVLLERGSNTVQPAIAPLLTVSALADDRRDFVLAAARQLMNLAPDAGWPTVWPLVLADEAFGTALFRGLADFRRPKLGDRLGEDELGELFAWLEERFPHADDPDDPDGSVSTRTQMAWWRDALASELATVGTSEAVAQLDRLVARFPQVPWLAALRANAQEAVRRSRWRPPSPSAIVRMGADAARRWVRSDAELREVLLESLGRAQDELQAVTPAAIDLWDTVAERPKSENEISDWLQRWLRQDLRGRGVLVDREVQITPGPRGKMGQSGDLVVSALAGQRTPGADVVTVTVEVKGCWNRDLDTAMQTQLVERYLATVGRREGIYLVAWFGDGTGWTTDHRARSRGIRRDLSDARAFFADQARRLSAAGPVTVDSVVLDCSQGSAVRAA